MKKLIWRSINHLDIDLEGVFLNRVYIILTHFALFNFIDDFFRKKVNQMGKRKAKARKPMKKGKQALDKEFDCIFCNHENSITVKLYCTNYAHLN